jgi:molecular chaperone DnaK (HSP70)
MDKSEISEIDLYGGLSLIPKVRELVKGFFNGKNSLIGLDVNDIAMGASTYALY